jgi:hypothetical protein
MNNNKKIGIAIAVGIIVALAIGIIIGTSINRKNRMAPADTVATDTVATTDDKATTGAVKTVGTNATVSTKKGFNTSVAMNIGDSVTFSDGLIVMVKQIDDSRCKSGMQCPWAGEIGTTLIIKSTKPNMNQEEVRLGTVVNKSAIAQGYKFSLEKASPGSVTIRVNDGIIK